MSHHRKPTLLLASLLVAATYLMMIPPGNASPDAVPAHAPVAQRDVEPQATTTPQQLRIWNVNAHSGVDHTYFKNFWHHTHVNVATAPDIVTIQEVGKYGGVNSQRRSCGKVDGWLERINGHKYKCRATNTLGGNSVIFRAARFEFIKQITVDSETGWTGTCVQNAGAHPSLIVLLRDKEKDTYLTVSSLHFPPQQGLLEDCTKSNVTNAHRAQYQLGKGYGVSLRILGGDLNEREWVTNSSYWEPWYMNTSRDFPENKLGYRDVVTSKAGTCGPALDPLTYAAQTWMDCITGDTTGPIEDYWTHKSGFKRLDFLFVKGPGQVCEMETVNFGEATAAAGLPANTPAYSDHRGVGALVARKGNC